MGNVSTAPQGFAGTLNKPRSVRTRTSSAEEVQDDYLLSELSALHQVELLRVQWCLSQRLLRGFPPIPPHWLQSADACSTAKVMLECYTVEGALTMLDAALKLIDLPDRVNHHHHHHTDPPRPKPATKPYPHFVKSQRKKLICKTWSLNFVIDALQKDGVLSTPEREAINIYAVQRDKNRALVDLLLRKGNRAHEVFYKALSQSDPFFLQELEDGLNADMDLSNPIETSEPPFLLKMLDFLDLDELTFLQWLVTDHTTGENHLPSGDEQLQQKRAAINVMQKIVPTISVCLPRGVVTSENSPDFRVETFDAAVVEITPQVFEDSNMFRLRCQQPGVFCCSLTGLLLEGVGDVVYQAVPWDVGFLASKGLRPAGPLYRFTLLAGRFHRLHLPHCQVLSDDGRHPLSVAHVTADNVEFIAPGQVTKGHVIIDVSSFSCFGLVKSEGANDPVASLVLLFHQLSEHSLFVLLLPRNVCLTQVTRELKQRIGADYVETVPNAELIPNQTYILSGQPVVLIQPESSKYVNFSDYTNFLPSFQVQLAADVRKVELQLRTHVTPLALIGWLFPSTESVVWHRIVQLRAASSAPSTEVCVSEPVVVTLLLLEVLNSFRLEDLKTFQQHLSLRQNPIPVSRLEAADRIRTVDLMVQQYKPEGAKRVMVEILWTMSYNQLAEQLQNR